MPKIVELRQNRNYVRNNFDGYKLSLDPVPVLRQEHIPPRIAKPNEEQYSLLHAELFSIQNHLQADPWERYTAYYINYNGGMTRCAYNESTGRPEPCQTVFKLPMQNYVQGDYNCSMRFISEKYCVICDGMRQLYLLDTGDRRKSTEWKEVATAIITTPTDEPNFMLYDCRLDIIQEQKQISLALGRVEHEVDTGSGSGGGGGSLYFLRLHWAKWIQKDPSNWELEIVETLEGKGSLYYCAFEPRGESLILSSNRDFHFKSQQINERILDDAVEKPRLHGESETKYDFAWTQSSEDVVIKIAAKENSDKKEYKIQSTADKLKVEYEEQTMLDEILFEKVDADLTTWKIEHNVIEVTLTKQAQMLWPSLLSNGAGPKDTSETNGVCVPAEQQPIANLEAPIEDCDFPMGTMEFEVKIERFNLPTKTVTHSVLLGGTPPLFSTNIRPGFPMAIATRIDVDASLWLQHYNPSKPDEWSFRHEGNLHAFGYVQASKQQRKFMDCSPDLSYAIICESFRHVFLYKMNYDTANGLRNRNGPQVTIGKQHLITLDDTGEVLGIATAPNLAILLTEKCLLFLQIN